MTGPDRPRPEVSAHRAFRAPRVSYNPGAISPDRRWMSVEVGGAVLFGESYSDVVALPAPFAIVDMDEWRALADEARLVSQWADSLDPMPEVLRGELRDLGTSARRLLGEPPTT